MRAAIGAGKHIVMAKVEADVLAGPLLAEEAQARGVVYSLAYGDQPALTRELVDWPRACGFEVTAAGKGTKYLPAYHAVTSDDIWTHYGLTPDESRRGDMNPEQSARRHGAGRLSRARPGDGKSRCPRLDHPRS